MKTKTILIAGMLSAALLAPAAAFAENPTTVAATRAPQVQNLSQVVQTLRTPTYVSAYGFEGEVLARVYVSPKGRVTRAEILSADSDQLAAVVLNNVKRLRFSPAVDADGVPVAASIRVPFRFEAR